MFQRILVAVDKSSASRAAYQRAIALAQAFKANLMIFHSLFEYEAGSPEIPTSAGLPYMTELDDTLRKNYHQAWQTFEQEYTDYLKWLVNDAKLDGINADFVLTHGAPGRSICAFAKEWQADLIVTGSQGKSGLSELLLGSVSNYITHHAPCNVLIAHQQDANGDSPDPQSRETVTTVQ
jgi:nucleotide-binding universal stress UspA family protein